MKKYATYYAYLLSTKESDTNWGKVSPYQVGSLTVSEHILNLQKWIIFLSEKIIHILFNFTFYFF